MDSQANPSIYRKTLLSHVLCLVAVTVFLTGLFFYHIDYDRKVRQFTELTTLSYLFGRIEEPLQIDLQNHSRRFLLDYYSQITREINELSLERNNRWNWGSYDLDTKMISMLEDNYLSYGNFSLDDLRYLWDQDRITLELPVIDYESIELMIDKVTTTFESRYSITEPYSVKFDIKEFDPATLSAVYLISATYGNMHFSDAVSLPIRMHRFTIDELNNLKMSIDGLYNSIYIVSDIGKSFDFNFPSLKSLPDAYQGLPPEKALSLAELEIKNTYIKYSPPAEVIMLLMCILCTIAYIFIRVPIIEIGSVKPSPRSYIKAFIIGILPFSLTTAVALFTYIYITPYIMYSQWFCIVVGTIVGLQGVVFSHRFGVYMCLRRQLDTCANHEA
ncbi:MULTISPECIES: hypothetical protein [Vibrio]|uniref:hypothetical protein n=1 Tax=Vibrio TaxID=662 RepID=UPI00078DFFFE|nr:MULTISPECIES: hypothetical protein [Vibrio]BAU70922.1 hypothetical protein [Vibrio sp. 04Ya108]BBM67821.1 hypothetical protein VA249_44670 [Vibrio alfacsensis]BCN26991.1 hypothetical protein VYA_41830 [Vibrio alfacsensis]